MHFASGSLQHLGIRHHHTHTPSKLSGSSAVALLGACRSAPMLAHDPAVTGTLFAKGSVRRPHLVSCAGGGAGRLVTGAGCGVALHQHSHTTPSESGYSFRGFAPSAVWRCSCVHWSGKDALHDAITITDDAASREPSPALRSMHQCGCCINLPGCCCCLHPPGCHSGACRSLPGPAHPGCQGRSAHSTEHT